MTLFGAYRPLIGSVSGIIVYFLFQTPLIPFEQSELTLPFFVVVSFLAGFSERWTTMMLSGAMRTVADDEPEPEPEPKAGGEGRPGLGRRWHAAAKHARVADPAGDAVRVEALEQQLGVAAAAAGEVAEAREGDLPGGSRTPPTTRARARS